MQTAGLSVSGRTECEWVLFRICKFPQMKNYLVPTFTLVIFWFLPATLYAQNNEPLLPVEMITINAFIPDNTVDDPRNIIPFTRNTVFEGDNRKAGTPPRSVWNENGAHRVQHKFNIVAWHAADADGLQDNAYAEDPDGVQNDNQLRHIGESREYDKATSLDAAGNLTAAARADTVLNDGNLLIKKAPGPKTNLWIDWTESGWLGDRKVKITCRSRAFDPLVPLAGVFGPLEYKFTFIIDKTDPAHPTYSLTGDHDGFPSYEIYINHTRVYQHDPLITGEGLSSLGFPMEHDVNATTSHVNQPLP